MPRLVLIPLLTAAGLLLAGCAAPASNPSPPPQTEQVAPGDIPDTQVFVPLTAADGRWRVQVPEGWSQRSVSNGVALTDKFNSITISAVRATDAPTLASVRTREVARLRSSTRGFALTSVDPFRRAGGSGVLIRFAHDSGKDPVTERVHRQSGEQYLFFRSGQEVQLTLDGAQGADNVDPWRIVSDSFRWVR